MRTFCIVLITSLFLVCCTKKPQFIKKPMFTYSKKSDYKILVLPFVDADNKSYHYDVSFFITNSIMIRNSLNVYASLYYGLEENLNITKNYKKILDESGADCLVYGFVREKGCFEEAKKGYYIFNYFFKDDLLVDSPYPMVKNTKEDFIYTDILELEKGKLQCDMDSILSNLTKTKF